MDILGYNQNIDKEPKLVDFSPIILGQDPEFDKIIERDKQDMDFYKRAVALEGRSLGVPGMAQIARTMENRRNMVASGTVKPGYFRVDENESYTDPSQYTMTDILKGRGQFEVYDPTTDSLPDQKSGPLTEEDLMNAAEAISIASNRDRYIEFTKQHEDIPERSYMNLGFRTDQAFDDPSQMEGRYQYGNTIFNQQGYREYMDR